MPPTDNHVEDDAGGRPTGYVPSGATGTTAVREQLAAVKKELDFISQQLCGPGGQVQAIDLQEVERLVKHLEVDREELAQRCHRLAQENKELLEVNKNLEAALYATKRELEDATRKLQHQEVDEVDRDMAGSSQKEDCLTQEALQALQSAMQPSPARPSKAELVRALRKAQVRSCYS